MLLEVFLKLVIKKILMVEFTKYEEIRVTQPLLQRQKSDYY